MAKHKTSAEKWAELSQQVLDSLDIEAEYRRMGLDITGKNPSSKGWLTAWAAGRPHGNSPSAAIHVGSGPLRGRYRDLGGTGESLSLWDFAAKYGRLGDWKEARRHFAKQAGLARRLPKEEDERPEDSFEFVQPANPAHYRAMIGGLLKEYAVSADAVELCGGRIAKYPKKSIAPTYCVALPAYGPHLLDGGPRGYCLMPANGKKLPLYQGEGAAPRMEKRISKGSTGLVGQHALTHLDDKEVSVIWKVEGMSDLLALQTLIPPELRDTHLVLTNLCGAHETTLPTEIAPLFAGKNVVIVHDSDTPGQDGAKFWIGALTSVSATVRNLVLPYPVEETHGKDLRDWIAEGKTYQDLLDLAAAVQPVKPEEAAAESLTTNQAILKRMGIIVVGEIGRNKVIVCFSQRLGKVVEIQKIEKYQLPNAIQDFGVGIKDHVYTGQDAPPPDQIKMSDLRNILADEAGQRRMDEKQELGVGVWELGGRLVLVGSDEIVTFNGHLERSRVPALEGKLFDFGGSKPWYNFEHLERLLEQSRDPQWCCDVMREATELFARWDNWKHSHNPQLIASLVVCTWLQTVWDWRPLIAVAGPTNSGKSMLLQIALQALYGPMAIYTGKPSEAGVRQEVRNSAKILILDEFEADANRQKVLELFRLSSRGGRKLMGTPGQKGASYTLRHIPWVGAIETGLAKAADKNRFLVLELQEVTKRPGDKILTLPSEEQLQDLGFRMLVVGMRHWRAAKRIAAELRGKNLLNVDHRVVESLSVPCGVIGAVHGLTTDEAAALMEKIIDERRLTTKWESDEERVVREIYESVVSLDRGRRKTVSELLRVADIDSDADEALQQVGVKLISSYGGRPERVFFSPAAIRRTLLKDSDFRFLQIDEILGRVKQAETCRQRMGGHWPTGVAIPTEILKKLLGSEEAKEQELPVQSAAEPAKPGGSIF